MHYPEMWGFLQFSDKVAGEGSDDFVWDPLETVKWDLRLIYYAERQYYYNHGHFSDDLSSLDVRLASSNHPGPQIHATPTLFEAILPSADGKGQVHIDQDGRTWITETK
jgi:hypothetical protein